jgi:predicted nucleic acid-binding protein
VNGYVISPQNVVEFWSAATRPVLVNGLSFSPDRADRVARRLEHLFRLVPDTPAIHTEWRRLVVALAISGRQVHDARLAAVMRAHGITHILTFDTADFLRYPGITAVHPRDVVATP